MAPLATRINTLLLLLVLMALLAVIGLLATNARGGPLDPTGSPASTDAVRLPGTPINSVPFTISQPGHYYMTRNVLGAAATNGITIGASNVTLDLGGFLLSGSGTGNGIVVPSTQSAVRITNGTVRGWTQGIDATNAVYSRIDNINVLDNTFGIDTGIASTLEDCNVSANTQWGVTAQTTTVRNCTMIDNGSDGLLLLDRNYVHNNTVKFNHLTDPMTSDVRAVGEDNIVVDNDISSHDTAVGHGSLDVSDGTGAVVIRNAICSSTISLGNYVPFSAQPDRNSC